MYGRDLQLLLSMVEDEYESNPRSFCATVFDVTRQFSVTDDEQLFKILKQQYGHNPDGYIGRVVTKRVYEKCNREDASLTEVVKSVCDQLEQNPRTISDDLFVRTLEQS